MTNRNQNGQFQAKASKTDETKPEPGSLLDSLRRLFTTAEREGDFSGAATLARVIRDLDKAASSDLDDDGIEAYRAYSRRIVSLMTEEEKRGANRCKDDARRIAHENRVLFARVALRSGIAPQFPAYVDHRDREAAVRDAEACLATERSAR